MLEKFVAKLILFSAFTYISHEFCHLFHHLVTLSLCESHCRTDLFLSRPINWTNIG